MSTDPKQSDKTAIQNPASSPASLQPWAADYPPGGEIDLVDLGVLLWRRWRLMLTVFLAIAVLAILAAAFKHPSYEYTAGIRLGYQITQMGTVVPLASPQSATNALQNIYIPAASAQYLQQAQGSANVPKITVNAGTDSNTVLLTCRGSGKLAQACIGIEKLASQNFIRDNSSESTTLLAKLQADLAGAKLNLQSLQSPAVFNVEKLAAQKSISESKDTLTQLKSDLVQHERAAQKSIADAKGALANLQSAAKVLAMQQQTLEDSTTLYKKQISELQSHISEVRKSMPAAAQGSPDPTRAMTDLLLNTQVQASVDQLNTLEHKLAIDTPDALATVTKNIGDNLRAQSLAQQTIDLAEFELQKYIENNTRTQNLQKQTITQNELALQKLLFSHGQDIQSQKIGITNLEAQITNIQDNKVLGDPVRSVKPVGLGRGAIVGLGIVIGIILAIFAALFASYIGQVRERLRFTKAAGK